MDRSNGYEGVAPQFLARRGSGRLTGIGVLQVREWARSLPSGAAVLDLGCGPGFPITEILVLENLNVFGVDASPSFVRAFQRNLPNTPIACEAVQDSRFFDRTFDGVLAWGLMFLLSPDDQRQLIAKIAAILAPGGRLLFTSSAEPVVWNDAMTGLESRSLGAAEYRRCLEAVGLSVASEYEDEGENHYFDTYKDAPVSPVLWDTENRANPGRGLVALAGHEAKDLFVASTLAPIGIVQNHIGSQDGEAFECLLDTLDVPSVRRAKSFDDHDAARF
jgi:SAM-dependent methyltransferase